MKSISRLTLGLSLAAAVTSLSAQSNLTQFFNNNNGSFTDSQSSLYNWTMVTANPVALVANNISAGNTRSSGYTPMPGEETLGRGFMFVVPTVNDAAEQPGASLMYTTHLVTSTVIQNNPQPDWYQDGALGIAGLTVAQIQQIGIRSSIGSASGISGHIGLQLNGTDWVFSSTGFNLVSVMTEFALTDLTAGSWYTNVFDGSALDADLTDNPTLMLLGTEVVTGYAYYGDTGTLGGNAARVRLDYIQVTAVPEPAAMAVLLGLLALGWAIRRRSR